MMINNKNILITGGTGSFGKEMAFTLSKYFKPKKIIIYSRDELKQSEMSLIHNKKNFRYFIGDVRDEKRLNLACRDVDIIIHAAAMKQVTTSEYNPMECINTNINGSQNIIDAAINNNVKKVIALSSDKAVSPLNLYGASKLASEKLFIAANNISGGKCIFSCVRYGNVSGSRGSVIPLFKKIENNSSNFFPITDLKMTRFFILLSEGVKFVLDSMKNMKGGEIFIPKLTSFYIKDLPKALNSKKKIKVTGIRPGEKIDEILFSKDESKYVLEFKKYFIIEPMIAMTKNKNYLISLSNEKGKRYKKNEEYSSGKNIFLKPLELRKILIKDNLI